MYGIGIAAQIYDLEGSQYFPGYRLAADEAARIRQASRRVSRTATLDGSSAIYDSGYAVADRIITLRVESATREEVDFLNHVLRTYSLIIVTAEDGAYVAVPESLTMQDGAAVLSMLIKETA